MLFWKYFLMGCLSKMMKNKIILSIFCLLFLSLECFADGIGNEDSIKDLEIEKTIFMVSGVKDKTIKMSINDCVTYALVNNSEILIKRIEPQLRQDDVKIAKADFEPTFTGEYLLHKNSEKTASSLTGSAVSEYRDTDFNVGIDGKFVTGTMYSVDFLNQRYKSSSPYQTINPYYTSEPNITVTQPVLRNFGILINKSDIIIAQNNKLESDKLFASTVMDVVSRTKSAYYNYAFAMEGCQIAKFSLERAENLLEINRARYAKGLISSVDLLETEAATAEREKTLVLAEGALSRTEDVLKVVTNLINDPELWNSKMELSDQPQFQQKTLDLLTSLESAFKYRPDYQAAKIDLENRGIRIKVSKNALLPTVDLVGSFGLNGLDSSYSKALKGIDPEYKDWTLGVKVNVPWGGSERAVYDQRKLQMAEAILKLKKLEHDIIFDVRDKLRAVTTQRRQVEVAKLSKEKETENYHAQKERYIAGQVSTHDILDYQDKLANSEYDYIKSLVEYNIALINLENSEGLTLVKNNIKLEE